MFKINISEYLKTLGLQQYIEAFEEEAIDLEVLFELTEADLKSLGMKLGHIKKLLRSLDSLQKERKSTYPVSAVIKQAEDFPSLISAPLFDYIKEPNAKLRLWDICDFVELSLRLIVVTGLAQIRNDNDRLPDYIVNEIRTKIEHPTLGKWLGMAMAISKDKSVSASLKETVFILQKELQGSGYRDEKSSLLTLRNFLAHGGSISQLLAHQLISIWEPKFERLIAQLKWFSSFQIIAKDTNVFKLLKGNIEDIQYYEPSCSTQEMRLNTYFTESNNVVLKVGDDFFSLWPLYFYENSSEYINPVQNMFVRRGELFLEYTPVGSLDRCQSQSNKEALDTFIKLFQLEDRRKNEEEKQYKVRGFESEILSDSKKFVGRVSHLTLIKSAIQTANHRVFWITGNAGIGKSYLMSATTIDLHEDRNPYLLILPYRFKAGDDRCYRNEFIKYSVERLNNWEGVSSRILKAPAMINMEDLKKHLMMIKDGYNVLFILDGLDELPERDQLLATEICNELSLPKTKWICSGRTNPKLDRIFDSSAYRVFPEGVPGMEKSDIQSMIYEKIGLLRKKVIIREFEQDTFVINPFVEQVWKYSKGIPLYVTYVIGDILSNKIKEFDGHSDVLPPSIFHYHQELVKRCSVGLYQQILPRLIANIAIAKEALTQGTLLDILMKEDYLPQTDKAKEILHKCLSFVSPMLKKVSSSDEAGEGFILYHTSLLDFLLQDEESKILLYTARKSLIKLIKKELHLKSESDIYLLKWGIVHLLEDDQNQDELLASLLGSSQYLQEKFQYQQLEYLLDDVNEGYLSIGNSDKQELILESFLNFILENSGNPSEKIAIEDIHSLFVYRQNVRFYEDFLNFATKKLEVEKGELSPNIFEKIYPSFLLRKGNLLRRNGKLSESKVFLEKALAVFGKIGNLMEIEKLEYDLAYVQYLQGNTEDAYFHFEKSKQHAIENQHEVGYWISNCIQAHTRTFCSKNKMTNQQFIEILAEALPYFVKHSRNGNENAKRWIKNIYQHSFLAAYEIRDRSLAEECYEKMRNNEWIQKFDEGNLDKYKARLFILRNEKEKALQVFSGYLDEGILDKESMAREYLEYSRLLKEAGQHEKSIKMAANGLACPVNFGNSFFQEGLNEVVHNALKQT
ncbi:NACHT domain-containing protein [Neobacillus sp. K501]